MGKFDKELSSEQSKMASPYIAFQWETGFVVIAQENFNKLTKKQQRKLMAKALPQ